MLQTCWPGGLQTGNLRTPRRIDLRRTKVIGRLLPLHLNCRPGMQRLLVITVLVLAGACASTEDRDERLRPPDRLDEVSVIGVPQLAEQSPEIATPQLYPGEEEGRLPILTLGSGDQLTLRFDLLADAGRPLSGFFYHADRERRRELSPAESLSTSHRARLLDYRPADATDDRYH